jgi:hypothetical protein
VRIFKDRLLGEIFGPKREEVKGRWRMLHTDKLHYLPSSPNVIKKTTSRRMLWPDMWELWEI